MNLLLRSQAGYAHDLFSDLPEEKYVEKWLVRLKNYQFMF